jgi:acyl carrier protein
MRLWGVSGGARWRNPGKSGTLWQRVQEVPMERAEIEGRARQVTARVLGLSPQEISAQANFIFDLGADSMQSLELVAAFEEEFGIEMDEGEALSVQTVSGAVDYIQKVIQAGE